MDRHNWLCCKWVNNNVLPSIFNIPHLPKSKIFVCSHVLKEDFSNLNTHLTKASEQYCPHPPVWGPGSTVRGEQWMCYSTVGWVPPACAPPTMTTHICYILNRHFCAHSLLWSSLRSLFGSHAPMTGSTFVSSPLTEEGRFCSITIANSILPLCSLVPAWAADMENPSTALSPFSSRLPGSFYRWGEPACIRGPWSHCTAYAQTHTRLVWRHAHHAFTRRLLCEHPLPSSLPSSLSLIQQLPAGLIHTESPEYCWPGGSPTSLKRSMGEFEI